MVGEKTNKKLLQCGEIGYKLRIWHKKGTINKNGTLIKCPRYLIKCGCCNNSVKIYYDNDSIEINGVDASIEEWRKLLLPLLNKTTKYLCQDRKTEKCKTCLGYGLWAMGNPSPMGPMDAHDGVPTIPCPECKADANPRKRGCQNGY